MSTGIVVVIVVVIIVIALAIGVAATARRRRLQQQFGPEYDRLAREHDSKRKAEAELAQRQRRVRKLDIRPLSPEAQEQYSARWMSLQERFVDDPEDAVAQSQTLVAEVMHERGYPTEHRDQVAADLSVEHAKTIGNFRAAEEISQKATAGTASTEDLRQAMIHYRALFRDLLGDTPEPGDEPAVPAEAADGEFASSQTRSGEVPPPAADYEGYEPAAGRHAATSAPVNGETARDAMTRDAAAADRAATEEPAPGQTGRRS
ncbi:MAG TPA: hypothetical protein VIF35_06960 [Streptosporangiaceae bacterium]|jgi:hypothetical protein